MKMIRVLILEDDLLTLSKLLEKFTVLENEFMKKYGADISVVVLSEYTQVEKYINSDINPEFDLVLLDRDCKAGGSFHTLDFDKFGVEKIIAISSVPEYNTQAANLGVTRIVHKNYEELDSFTERVIVEMQQLLY